MCVLMVTLPVAGMGPVVDRRRSVRLRYVTLLVLVGCSQYDPWSPPGPVDAAPEAEPPAVEAGSPVACVPTESCGLMEQETCDGGVVYGCTFGSCPSSPDVGDCRVLAWSSSLQSGRSCCPEAVCVRSKVPTDALCAKPSTDAGTKRVGWVCPKGEKPEGACLGLHGSASQEFCCED
jgi:hypothetical protein